MTEPAAGTNPPAFLDSVTVTEPAAPVSPVMWSVELTIRK